MKEQTTERFDLGACIGSGNTAVVCAVNDRENPDQDLVLKIAKKKQHQILLSREFSLLFNIQHPHIMRVYDMGRLSKKHTISDVPVGAPYLLLEKCVGRPAQLWASEKPEKSVLKIGAQIASALATLHSRHIQHGDIKPENILVQEEPTLQVKVIDFNMAVRGVSQSVSGTVRYMAPEALSGKRQIASDIYSLAATLVELLTGAPPQVPPGEQLACPGMSHHDLIEAMSHPDPNRRLDAANAFTMLTEHLPLQERETLIALRDSQHLSTGFVGQSAFVEMLKAKIPNAKEHTQVIRVQGTAGSGKTTILKESLAIAAQNGFSITGALRSARCGELIEIANRLTTFDRHSFNLSDLSAQNGECSNHPWEFFYRLCDRLEEITRDQPIAIAFDDVPINSPLDQFSRFLERLGIKGPPLLWLQSYQPHQYDSPQDTWDIPLHNVENVRQMIQLARPLRPVDTEAAEALHQASGGNPYLINGLLSAYPHDHLLRSTRAGKLKHSASISKIIVSRYQQLSQSEQEMVLTLAFLTPPVTKSLLQSIFKNSDPHDAELLQQAKSLGLIRTYFFQGEAVFELAGAASGDSLQNYADTKLLTQIAQTLEKHDPHQARAAELGQLWCRLGQTDRAVMPLISGARQATKALRTLDAVDLYNQLLKLPSLASDFRAQATIELGRLLLSQGMHRDAYKHFYSVPDHAFARIGMVEANIAQGRYQEAANVITQTKIPPGENQGKLDALIARAHYLAGNIKGSQDTIIEARQRINPHPNHLELMNVEGLLAYSQGDLGKAKDILQQALYESEQSQMNWQLCDTLRSTLALILHKTGNYSEAEKAYFKCLAITKSQYDLPRQIRRLTNLTTLRQEQDHYDTALSGYEEAYHLAYIADSIRDQVRIIANWTNLLCHLGDTESALPKIVKAIALAENLSMNVELAYLQLIKAETALMKSNYQEAEEASREAAQLFEAKDTVGMVQLQSVLTELAIFRRDIGSAREHAHSMLALAQKSSQHQMETQALIWFAVTDLADPMANIDQSIASIRKAITIAESNQAIAQSWMTHGLASQLLMRAGNHSDADFHLNQARHYLSTLRSHLNARYESTFGNVWFRKQLWVYTQSDANPTLSQASKDIDRLLAINRELAQDHNPRRLLERIIDAAIALSGAERGFIILRDQSKPEDEKLLIRSARNIDQETLQTQEFNISRSIAIRAMKSETPITSINALDDDRFQEFLSVHELKLRSVLCLPLRSQNNVLGALYLDNRFRVNAFSETDVALLSAFGDQAAIALANARLVNELENRSKLLEKSREEIEVLNQRLEKELHARSEELELARVQSTTERYPEAVQQHGMIGKSSKMIKIYRVIDRVADKNVPVIVLGDSGTGKELVARAIHVASPRNKGSFVSLNCGAVPPELLESELFGHEKGAFTGAVRKKPGLFEIAQAGTIFLDEIGEMPFAMQVKLLRVLQQKEFRRVGGNEQFQSDARVISASNKDIENMVRQSQFREDLWYRLNVVEIHVPPLRERKEDISFLVSHFLKVHGGSKPPEFSRKSLALLLDYHWPGNVRELENEIQRAVALAEGKITPAIMSEKLCKQGQFHRNSDISSLKNLVDSFEMDTIRLALREHSGKVALTSKSLGLTRAGLYKKMRKYGLS